MSSRLVPARLGFEDGIPYSEAFGDRYHSAQGGPEQARHVFLAGNGLPGRWRGRERFTILETGFGFGLNFLATWQAWRNDPARCRRLHFVSVEAHPFSLPDLRTLHARYPEFSREAAELHAQWPVLVSGGHRAQLDSGQVILTLFFADIKIVRELRLAADAIYLDGFAPAKNPGMWAPALLRSISRIAAPGATAATWSVAAPVRAALESTGFAVERRAGYGHKREMLAARLVRPGNEIASLRDRQATVVGAGLAGAAVCERLCARGWAVRLVERHAEPAREASGNHAGTFHPIVTPDDSVFARLTRAGFLYASQAFERAGARWDPCGVLQLARTDKEAASQQAAIAALGLPPDYAQWVSREAACAHAGVPVAAGGLWFARAGWMQPRSLVDSLLEMCGSRLQRRFSTEVLDIGKEQGLLVLANSADALKLHPMPEIRLRRVRGQVTHVPAERIEAPRVVVLRGGFVLPPVEGLCVVGASYDIDDDDPAPRADGHAGNLERMKNILCTQVALENPQGRVGFRSVAPDRLPLVGALGPDVYGLLALGSRGLTWAMLAAELLASALEGEPLPIEAQLAAALDPRRFARRALARSAGRRAAPP